MVAMSAITISHIPLPPSDEHVTKYKTIRLAMLFTNPEAFGSTYEEQSLFTHDQWKERVDTRGRTTLFAAVRSTHMPTMSSATTSVSDTVWVGSLSILEPNMLASVHEDMNYPPRIADGVAGGYIEVYMLVGMWVDPTHRGKGVSRALIAHALDVVHNAPVAQDVNATIGTFKEKERVVLLQVHNTNNAAIRLYLDTGFKMGVDDEGGVVVVDDMGRRWMAISVSS